MSSPLFSIVIANYNYGRFLDDAIKSVIAQNMSDEVELIICDGGSSDNSVEIIRKYANGLPQNTHRNDWLNTKHQFEDPAARLITWWCSEKDGGQSAAFNKGFSHAKGRLLTWLNADDILTPGALRAVARVAEKYPDCEWCTGSSCYADEMLRVTKCFCAHAFSPVRARWGVLTVGGPSTFFSLRLLRMAGGFDESLHYVMDTDLWYKFYFQCNVRYRRTLHNIFAYRRHEASKMSGADDYKTERALENRRRSREEAKILDARYNRHKGFVFLIAHILSFSVRDKFIAWWRDICWRGHDAREI